MKKKLGDSYSTYKGWIPEGYGNGGYTILWNIGFEICF